MQNPAGFSTVATRAPDDTRGRQNGAHGGAFHTCDIGAQFVARSSRRLEQPLRGQAFHQGSECVRDR